MTHIHVIWVIYYESYIITHGHDLIKCEKQFKSKNRDKIYLDAPHIPHDAVLAVTPRCSVTIYHMMQCYQIPLEADLPITPWCIVTWYPMMQFYQIPLDAVLPITPWCTFTRYPLLQCFRCKQSWADMEKLSSNTDKVKTSDSDTDSEFWKFKEKLCQTHIIWSILYGPYFTDHIN